jgi:hypothetical protein
MYHLIVDNLELYLYNAPAARINDTLAIVTPDNNKVYLRPSTCRSGKNTDRRKVSQSVVDKLNMKGADLCLLIISIVMA